MKQAFHPYQQQIKQVKNKINENKLILDDPELGKLAQAEIDKLNKQLKTLEKAAKDYAQALKSSDDEPSSDISKAKAIVEIRAGAGGDEAKIWADDLMRMYVRYLSNKDLKIKYIDDLIFKVSGRTTLELDDIEDDKLSNKEKIKKIIIYPYQLLKMESGVHRVQRVPTTETQGRIHTSTASVAILPEVPTKSVKIKEEDLDWQFMRSSGAGGQSVNKTSSAVRLTHNPTGIVVVSRQERKQIQNREIALSLLRSQLWEIEEKKRQKKIGNARSAIGRNMRAEKIRTYNYPQNRITDHRVSNSWHNLESIIDGNLDDIVSYIHSNLRTEEQEK